MNEIDGRKAMLLALSGPFTSSGGGAFGQAQMPQHLGEATKMNLDAIWTLVVEMPIGLVHLKQR